jgi:UDP-N-acetylglucosamine 2-epimerase (non-hydrolysing)
MFEMIKLMSVFGTRPEAIKMAPLVSALAVDARFETRICVTGQHRQMLDQVISIFDLNIDHDLDVMSRSNGLSEITSTILLGMGGVLQTEQPDMVLVHGDTATTLATSLACYYHKIPVAHIEAGLRTGNLASPWPEEGNRKLVGALAELHFAPTPSAAANLQREGIDQGSIYVTGNTVVDALNQVLHGIENDPVLSADLAGRFKMLRVNRPLVLVTGHRRENFGRGFERICMALAQAASQFPFAEFLYPVHLNPNVKDPVLRALSGISNIHLVEPLDYAAFIFLMERCRFILTDSGGIQEEAVSLGKPVLLMREVTERPEGVACGIVKLVGTDLPKMLEAMGKLLGRDPPCRSAAGLTNLYGDGQASSRIIEVLVQHFAARR